MPFDHYVRAFTSKLSATGQHFLHNVLAHPLIEVLSILTHDRVRWEWLHYATVPDDLAHRETPAEALLDARELLTRDAPTWRRAGHYLVLDGEHCIVWVEEKHGAAREADGAK